MELSSKSMELYSDSFNSASTSTHDAVSGAISKIIEDNKYTTDSFNTITTESIHEQSYSSRHSDRNTTQSSDSFNSLTTESIYEPSHSSRHSDGNVTQSSDSGRDFERTEHSYDVDTFETKTNDYSSDFIEDESVTEDSLDSKDDQLQKKFLKALVKKVKKNATIGCNDIQDEIDQTDSHAAEEVNGYCHRKLHLLRNGNIRKETELKRDTLQYIEDDDDGARTTLPFKRRLEEMKIENIRHKMKKRLDEVVEHDINTCPACIKTQEEIAEKQFVGRKNTYLQNKLIEERVQRHIEFKVIAEKQFVGRKNTYLQNKLIEERVQRHLEFKNSISLIGDLAASLPKPSDDPQQIWTRLLNR